jgi:hypothetical protein
MSSADGAFVLAGLALVVSCLAACVASWRSRSGAQETVRLREELESHRAYCAENLEGVSKSVASLELGARASDEPLNSGRLNHSTRAEAVQLLRMGISPDTAAMTVGVATREVRLLAEVERLLASL